MRILKEYKDFQKPRQLSINKSDVEPLKYKYQIGLETLVVYTMNQWILYV